MEERIEQGTIFDVQRFTVHEGPGIRTAIFMKGCPLRCPWCQNPESIRQEPQISYFPTFCIGCANCVKVCKKKAIRSSGKSLVEKINLTLCDHCGLCAKACNSGALRLIGRTVTVEEVCEIVMQDILFYQNSGGGVTFTGGEPTYQPEFLKAVAKACKKQGLHLVIETCGLFSWDVLAEALTLIDIFYLDIKHPDSEKHRAVIGESNSVILENIRRIDRLNKPIRIRIPLIPGFNDSIEAFGAIVRVAAGLTNLEKIQLLPYHKFGISKFERIGLGYSLTGLEAPAESTIEKLLALAKRQKVACSL
jgi:pyruvate formate lyase activating enzyme